ncbi:unnamed protein product [Soboliphyme baturini]|uniref:ANK_REP_REGION domain-containing protein n=1 Tax=Soboliphyme baturini TaxID=241478 RepID=A0A183IFA9_9BILA|nr:unnamed protein product [Soboliphyme baturini]
MGYTPLHQAAQQGHAIIVKLLLEYGASPNVVNSAGQTPLAIAQKLGYISVVETLRTITETTIITETTTVTEERYKVLAPETMQETFISESEDEADESKELDVLVSPSPFSTLRDLGVRTDSQMLDTSFGSSLSRLSPGFKVATDHSYKRASAEDFLISPERQGSCFSVLLLIFYSYSFL